VIFFEHKYLYRLPRVKEDLPVGDYIVPIGKAAVRRSGKDITMLTYGAMLYHCLDAAEALDREGVDAEVIDLRTLLPLDREAIVASAKKTGKVLVVHEDTRTGGIAGEIAAIVNEEAFEHLDGPVLRVTAPDTPVPYSPPLEEFFLPNVEKVLAAARRLAAY
jgi:2-oxoisovalerate dehydrogenase E1 component beta subunit